MHVCLCVCVVLAILFCLNWFDFAMLVALAQHVHAYLVWCQDCPFHLQFVLAKVKRVDPHLASLPSRLVVAWHLCLFFTVSLLKGQLCCNCEEFITLVLSPLPLVLFLSLSPSLHTHSPLSAFSLALSLLPTLKLTDISLLVCEVHGKYALVSCGLYNKFSHSTCKWNRQLPNGANGIVNSQTVTANTEFPGMS